MISRACGNPKINVKMSHIKQLTQAFKYHCSVSPVSQHFILTLFLPFTDLQVTFFENRKKSCSHFKKKVGEKWGKKGMNLAIKRKV